MQGQHIMVQEEPRGPSILIEVNVTANGQQRITFPDVAQLRSTVDQKIIIKCIRLVPPEILTNGVLSGNVTAPVTELQKMTVVIYSQGWEKGQYIPALTFNDYAFATGSAPFRFNSTYLDNWTNVDWPKSYLQFANGTTSVGAPYTVLFDVQYVKLDGQNRQIPGPSN